MHSSRRTAATVLTLLPAIVLIVTVPRIAIAGTVLVLLPGLVAVRLAGWQHGGWGTAGLAAGTGLAVLVVTAVAWSMAGLPLSMFPAVYGGATVFAGVAVWRRDGPWTVPDPSWPGAAIGGMVGVAMAVRLLPVLGMHAPLFADPAVEGTLARLLLDGGFPATWQPYAPFPVSHQPGFAAVTAVFSGMTGLSLPRTVLLLTQVVHGLLPVTVAALAAPFLSRWRRVVAVAVVAVAALPAVTFMVGMNAMNLGYVLVPVLVAVAMTGSGTWRGAVGTGVVALGTVLVHPVAVVLAGLLAAPLAAARWDRGRAVRGGLAAVLGVAVAAPYYRGTVQGAAARAAEQWTLQAGLILPGRTFHPLDIVEPVYTAFANPTGGWYTPLASAEPWLIPVGAPVRTAVLGLMVVAAWTGWRRRDRLAAAFASWYVVLLAAGPVQAAVQLQVPFWQYVYPSRAKFLVAVPVAFLVARSVPGDAVTVRGRDVPVAAVVLVAVGTVSLAGTAVALDGFAADPVVGDADVDAMRWLEGNAGDGAVLNQVGEVEAGAFIGGPGQWIPAVTGIPVVYPATSLTGNVTGMADRVAVQDAVVSRDRDRFARLADRYGVSHVYVSPRTMRSRGTVERFDAADVEAACDCEQVFRRGEVRVYRVR